MDNRDLVVVEQVVNGITTRVKMTRKQAEDAGAKIVTQDAVVQASDAVSDGDTAVVTTKRRSASNK